MSRLFLTTMIIKLRRNLYTNCDKLFLDLIGYITMYPCIHIHIYDDQAIRLDLF